MGHVKETITTEGLRTATKLTVNTILKRERIDNKYRDVVLDVVCMLGVSPYLLWTSKTEYHCPVPDSHILLLASMLSRTFDCRSFLESLHSQDILPQKDGLLQVLYTLEVVVREYQERLQSLYSSALRSRI